MPDFSKMTTEEFEEWKAANTPSFAGVRQDYEATEKIRSLEELLAKATAASVGQPLPPNWREDAGNPSLSPSSPQDYQATEKLWLVGDTGYDFTLPSGKHCRLRDMPIEDLAASGMLDRMTRLSGITQRLIDQSNGQPPAREADTTKAITELLAVLNVVVPMIVVQPKVWPVPPEGEERRADRIYPESIGLVDRIAILNRSAGGVMKFDNFRG